MPLIHVKLKQRQQPSKQQLKHNNKILVDIKETLEEDGIEQMVNMRQKLKLQPLVYLGKISIRHKYSKKSSL
ncbi:MAG: hypothetical protein SOY62_03660 [Streptococcus orisratti]|nr:hypothetical protein [Streptococcus orisratti]